MASEVGRIEVTNPKFSKFTKRVANVLMPALLSVDTSVGLYVSVMPETSVKDPLQYCRGYEAPAAAWFGLPVESTLAQSAAITGLGGMDRVVPGTVPGADRLPAQKP